MEWTLARTDRRSIDDAILGELFTGAAERQCWTLERPEVAIAPGRFLVKLTTSGRAERGELWCPRADHRLPELIAVPGRTGIRLHALNRAAQSLGCPGLSLQHDDAGLVQSQPAVRAVSALLAVAERTNEDVWITVSEPTQVIA